MGISDLIRKAFFEGYAADTLEVESIFFCIICTAVMASYIFWVYKIIYRNSFYNRNFNLSLIALAIITSAIILTIQSNIVVSLGMVGALSIVRFRTAIKDPMDLVFLFWSISIGIICGAGFVLIAIVASIIITIVIVLFAMLPESKGTLLLVVNAESYRDEAEIMKIVNENCQYVRTRAENVSKTSINLAIEVKVQDRKDLIEKLMELEEVKTASLVEHDGDATA